jgi:hypothetical protein
MARDAQRILEKAESLDGYLAAIQASPVNRRARDGLQYTPWNDQSLAKEASKTLGGDIQIVIVSPSTEGGMPHTRAPNVICLPAYWPQDRLVETLKHELIHISQRQNPAAWQKNLLREGWVKVEESELPEEWVARCRINPDTMAARWWAWEGRYVPMPVFTRTDKPSLKEIEVRWWDRKEARLNPGMPSSFVQKYGQLSASSAEHPYELWAYSKEKQR